MTLAGQGWRSGQWAEHGQATGDALSKRGRFWMPSWPTRAASPKREKPTMFERRDMAAEVEVVEQQQFEAFREIWAHKLGFMRM